MIKVLVVFGSMSSEHEISCISAANIIDNLDNNKYEITNLGIDKKGKMYIYNGDTSRIKNNTWIEDNENKYEVKEILNELKKYDVVFPVLHGKYGEDGAIQGLFELANVKYVGCDVGSSAIGMDKILCKKLVSSIGINVVDYIELDEYDLVNITKNNKELEVLDLKIMDKINYPVIIKPNKEGSSYGLIKVNDKSKLLDGLNFAFSYDNKVLIEKYIDNRQEIECAVLQNREKIHASTPGEIVSANELYDFDAKYENNKSFVNIPANISEEKQQLIREYATKIFRLIGFSGIARIDFFVSNNDIYFNEVNTLPGFTNISMYPKMLMHDNISYPKILDILINNANI